MAAALLSFWLTYGLHSIPRALKENLVHLVDVFAHLLPPYAGPGLTLYRGELEARLSRVNLNPVVSDNQRHS